MDWIGLPPDDRNRTVESTLRRAVLAIGFWGAVIFPPVAIALLAVVPTSADVVALVLLANVVCLVVGQYHDPAAGWIAGSSDRRPVTEGSR
ncbi:hypothetical protein Huta_2637 [Halorhabdus utahensis DSM 12940]|uniref:Uncharacterized protein n=1 Tax=Halorhabdus utahensis (strain DSM 12940 / JCM 11049 / AX-2) TaxID=519442 RepID=C7NML3_HALUD|nr:hypothetical protein [Halorhabdus utahensis]ACV12798.1 hypothetical protein Huta_2637 [Halorhabdus utahensis DSM 12940]